MEEYFIMYIAGSPILTRTILVYGQVCCATKIFRQAVNHQSKAPIQCKLGSGAAIISVRVGFITLSEILRISTIARRNMIAMNLIEWKMLSRLEVLKAHDLSIYDCRHYFTLSFLLYLFN